MEKENFVTVTRERAIDLLLQRVEEVINNGDWPTEEGQFVDDGKSCTCPIQQLVDNIRGGD
jgi:hypothetical protein